MPCFILRKMKPAKGEILGLPRFFHTDDSRFSFIPRKKKNLGRLADPTKDRRLRAGVKNKQGDKNLHHYLDGEREKEGSCLPRMYTCEVAKKNGANLFFHSLSLSVK